MILWTDLLAVLLLSVVALFLLRIANRQERRSRQIELGLKILLPLVWILILLALVQG